MEYAATFHNAEANITGLAFLGAKGYSAALRDDDAKQIVGCIFQGLTLEAAIAKAKFIAGAA